tara:strand:+ start:595 stop:1350 length:756 start_codon:yes stop_codon:yes gene_type:complete
MKLLRLLSLLSLFFSLAPYVTADQQDKKSIKALIVTGGCCHNYHFQTGAITEVISKVSDVNWTVLHEGGIGKEYQSSLYDDPNWAKPFDIVIHNECFAKVTDETFVNKVVAGHRETGIPGMVIHCAMHTYREVNADGWREFQGVTSIKHEHKSNYPVKVVKPKHPVMKGMPSDWVTPKDELYIIQKLWPHATVLAISVSERDGREHPVIWVNEYFGTRVFGTTYGHADETFADPVFMNLLVQGFLWAVGKD